MLSELPPTIGNLIHLTNFNVDRNQLEELPPQIGNLTKLGVLSLRDNRLTYLPVEIGQLRDLRVFDVSGNRLNHLPYTITALNLKALWLAENQSQPLLKFQTDYDEQSRQKVLTCFLLPQQEYNPDLSRLGMSSTSVPNLLFQLIIAFISRLEKLFHSFILFICFAVCQSFRSNLDFCR